MKSVPRDANIIRWIARIWSILVFLIAILTIFVPTEKSVTASNANPIAMEDAFLLSLYGVAILGLLLAYWKEALGAIINITCAIVQQIAFWAIKNYWDWAQILPVLFLTIPGILFLVAWGLEKRAKEVK